jgi:hypothetical protein
MLSTTMTTWMDDGGRQTTESILILIKNGVVTLCHYPRELFVKGA